MRSMISLCCGLLLGTIAAAQSVNIIPQPVSLKQPAIAATFPLNFSTEIVLEGSNLEKTAAFLNDYLLQFYKFKLKVVKKSTSKNVIRLNYERLDNELPGAYNMTVDQNGIYIAGDNEQGVFYGIQTLVQLLPVPEDPSTLLKKMDIPYLTIEDAPRFAYRGMHLDVSRHFFPVSFVKKYIDYLALHKFNTFHWHLTDDQGWRIEIKKYPKLTSIGGFRNGTIIGRYPGKGNDEIFYGGYYTQAQIKEVVSYAKSRYVEVIPEIEMPGHGSAAIAAYPFLSCFPAKPTAIPANMISKRSVSEQSRGRIKLVQETWGVFDDVFCAGKDSTFTFLQNVLAEVMPLFPSKYVHVGGDECPKTHWKICPNCQKRMKELGLKDEHELQSYFIQRMEKYLNGKGKTLIGWDEILEGGLAPNAIVMSWRGEKGGIEAAKQKHTVIMTPGNPVYFDHSQSLSEDSVTIGGYNPVEKVYAYEPVPKELNEEDAKYVWGAQANLWTEYIKNTRKIEYMVFPRMAALSEVLWGSKQNRNWEDFEKRLPAQFKRYDLWKANYSKAYFNIKSTVIPAKDNSGVLWKLESKIKNSRLAHALGETYSFTLNYTEPVKITGSNTYTGLLFDESKRLVATTTETFHINKATGKKVTLKEQATAKYPGDGAFTLVNGIQNTKGLARTHEFLGFEGLDCEATIDLGAMTGIDTVIVHTFESRPSWIWHPSEIIISTSADGNSFTIVPVEISKGETKTICRLKQAQPARYIKVWVKNHGTIPAGNAGEGHGAWLFIDEIEVK